MGEGFICTAHGDVVAVLVPADIYFVTRHAIEVREPAFDGLAVDICPVHERYFQFESKKLLAGFFIACCSNREPGQWFRECCRRTWSRFTTRKDLGWLPRMHRRWYADVFDAIRLSVSDRNLR